jgi:peptide deformylase
MKLFIVIVVSVVVISCSRSPEDELKEETRAFINAKILPQLKDPGSYQEASITIVDTLTSRDRVIESTSALYSDHPEKRQELIDSAANDDVECIVIEHKFRAKNGFGALDLGGYIYRYHPHRDAKERFELYDKLN